MLALPVDVTRINQTMSLVGLLEESLAIHDETTSKTNPINGKMKKICTNPEFIECLNRLEHRGEPVWGLSSYERNLIVEERNKVNKC